MECNNCTNDNNTGFSNCDYIMREAVGLISVKTFDNDGAKNKILLSTILNQAYLTAKINNTDPSVRWFPLLGIENVADVRAEVQYETMEGGNKFKVRNGIRNFLGLLPKKSAKFMSKLENQTCGDWSDYYIDANGNLIGIVNGDGYMYPVRRQANSFSSTLTKGTPTTVQKLALTFDIHISVKDSELNVIKTSEFDNVDLLSIEGLLDVQVVITSTGQTSMVFKLETDYGTAITKVLDEGLAIAELVSSVGGATSKVRNSTTSADVAVLTLSEVDGIYTITYASQTIGNTLIVKPLRNGREYTTATGTVV